MADSTAGMTDVPRVADSTAADADVVRRAYQAVSRGDRAELAALIADGAVWRVPGRSAVAGEYQGRSAVIEFLSRLRELSEGTLRVELTDLAASEAHGVALQRVTAARGGRRLDAEMCVVYSVRGGLLAAATYYVFDQHAYDEFWS